MFDKKKYMKQWQKDNPKKVKGYQKKWRENNPEKVKEIGKRWYEDNRGKTIERSKRWYKNNPEKAKEKGRRYYKNNSVKLKAYYKKYRKNNSEKVRKTKRSWKNKKYKIDSKYNLNHKIGHGILLSIKGNKGGRHWETLVGWTVKDLEKRLRKTMPKGYNWKDFKNGKLHIDHIIPISAFNYTKPEHIDFKRCWALKNLRLLPAKDNLEKSYKLEKPFQPTLKIDF